MTILMLYDAMVLAYNLFAYLSSLLKSLGGSFTFELFSHAKLTNQGSNCVCDDNFVTHKLVSRYAPQWYDMYAMLYDH